MKVNGYEIDFLVHGYPGRSSFHGGLGWSTIVLIRGGGRVALIDAGGIGMRRLLIERLAKLGVEPAAVTDLLLTHADHDHLINWTLFGQARIVIGAHELECALKAPWGETPVPELYVRELQGWPTLHTAGEGDEVFPGITAHMAPGHTRGHMVFVLKGRDIDVIFTGDAVKNRGELVSGQTDMTYDAVVSAASIDKVRELWRRRPGNILVPGHDLPMTVQEDGRIKYLGKREAAIKAWFGDNLETTTSFDLTIS